MNDFRFSIGKFTLYCQFELFIHSPLLIQYAASHNCPRGYFVLITVKKEHVLTPILSRLDYTLVCSSGNNENYIHSGIDHAVGKVSRLVGIVPVPDHPVIDRDVWVNCPEPHLISGLYHLGKCRILLGYYHTSLEVGIGPGHTALCHQPSQIAHEVCLFHLVIKQGVELGMAVKIRVHVEPFLIREIFGHFHAHKGHGRIGGDNHLVFSHGREGVHLLCPFRLIKTRLDHFERDMAVPGDSPLGSRHHLLVQGASGHDTGNKNSDIKGLLLFYLRRCFLSGLLFLLCLWSCLFRLFLLSTREQKSRNKQTEDRRSDQ